MTNQLTLCLVCLGGLLAGACSSSKLPSAGSDGSVAGDAGGATAGSGGSSGHDSGTSTGASRTMGGADAGAGGGSAGTGGGSAGTADGGMMAGAADGGMMASATCDPAVSSVSMCGANTCSAVSGSAQACTINCCTAHDECGTRTATLDGVSPCHVPPTCDSAVSSVSMCGTNTCPAVSGSAEACTVNCCDNMMRCGVRTAVQGDPIGKCQVPPACDSAAMSVTMCGTNTCAAVSGTAPACTINCCDGKMQCGTRAAIMGGGDGKCHVP